MFQRDSGMVSVVGLVMFGTRLQAKLKVQIQTAAGGMKLCCMHTRTAYACSQTVTAPLYATMPVHACVRFVTIELMLSSCTDAKR